MAISIRYYLFLDDGSLRRIPQRIAKELPFGRDGIPEFAGTKLRTAHVVLELQDETFGGLVECFERGRMTAAARLLEAIEKRRGVDATRSARSLAMALWGRARERLR